MLFYCKTKFFVCFKRTNKGTHETIILSCYFTKNRPSKIFKIEKINRQTNCKNGLILTKKMPYAAETMTLRSWKHTLVLLCTCFSSLKACKLEGYLNALIEKEW